MGRRVGRILQELYVTKDTAITLRNQGWSYKEISKKLGVSLDWCKRNLKGVKKGVGDPLVHELIQAATRPEGCTHYEAQGIVYKHYGEEEVTYEKVRQYKRAAKNADNRCVFRPSWMSVEDPVGCNQALLQEVSNLWDRVTDATLALCEKYPDASFSSMQTEVLTLLSQTTPEGIMARCERHEATATALSASKTALF